jgi:cohesin complex subunit SCC1
MASHVERKVAKTVLLRVNIPDSVDAITGGTEGDSHVEILALRLSGQLLLGVARIYSRKAKYLMDDCSEALLRLRSAFKSAGGSTTQGARARGDVDMPDQDDAGRGNININLALDAGRNADFDMLFNADFGGMGGMW